MSDPSLGALDPAPRARAVAMELAAAALRERGAGFGGLGRNELAEVYALAHWIDTGKLPDLAQLVRTWTAANPPDSPLTLPSDQASRQAPQLAPTLDPNGVIVAAAADALFRKWDGQAVDPEGDHPTHGGGCVLIHDDPRAVAHAALAAVWDRVLLTWEQPTGHEAHL